MQYSGHLAENDPLYGYLKYQIFPQLGCDCRHGIRVFGTNGSNAVYIYEERCSCRRVVGKFFYSHRQRNWDLAYRHLEHEHRSILEFRNYIDNIHYTAGVLGRNDDLNRLLVLEYCYGRRLDEIITEAIHHNNPQLLYDKLTALAWFLANLHNRSARQYNRVDFKRLSNYYNLIINHLQIITPCGYSEYLRELGNNWYNTPALWQDCQVLVHGDATPSNFFFGDGMHVIAFDLERSHYTDRLFDAGRICAELKHFFLHHTGNGYAAEPFIGHFLWEYSCHFPDRERTFDSITGKVPFYMGLNLLRIARNSYLPLDYRQKLISEASECLRRK